MCREDVSDGRTQQFSGYGSLGIVGQRHFAIVRWPGEVSELGCRWHGVKCGPVTWVAS